MARRPKTSMYRQGDVLLMAVDETEIPEGAAAVERDGGRVVLAYGEVTGHAHAIAEPEAELVAGPVTVSRGNWNEREEIRRFLLVKGGGATLRHEEHAPIPLEAGAYRVIQQREFVPQGSRKAGVRYVAD